MIKTCRALTILLLFALPAPAAHCAAKKPVTTKKAKPSPVKFGDLSLTNAEAQAFVKELLPVVEQTAGKKFDAVPKCELVRNKDIYNVAMKCVQERNKKMAKPLKEGKLQYCAFLLIREMASSQGMYLDETRTIYVMSDNFKKAVTGASVATKNYRDMYKLLLVHEMVHYLQSQTARSQAKHLQFENNEENAAIKAVMEGQAVFVVGKVTELLDTGTARKELERSKRVSSHMSANPYVKLVHENNMQSYDDTYLRGCDFVEWYYNQGGNEKVWEILMAPPATTSMILHPERYSPEYKPALDYHAVLEGLESELGGEWETANSYLGEFALREIYLGIDSKILLDAFGNIEHTQALFATRKYDAIFMVLHVMKDKSNIRSLLDVLEESYRKSAEAKEKGKFHQFNPLFTEAIKGIDADIAKKTVLTTKDSDVRYYEEGNIYVARGRVLIDIIALYDKDPDKKKTRVPDKNLINIAEKILSRLPAEMTGRPAAQPANKSDTAP